VHSVFCSVKAAGGVVISKKFDETSVSPLSIVLSAFNDLCLLIGEKQSLEENQLLYEKLQAEFGAHFFLLARTLPMTETFGKESAIWRDDSYPQEGESR
jgi:hypothetical protein